MEKQKLLFHQARLANRGVAEMTLLHISACNGVPSDMVMKTLQLGISILRGGNIDIQMVSRFEQFSVNKILYFMSEAFIETLNLSQSTNLSL